MIGEQILKVLSRNPDIRKRLKTGYICYRYSALFKKPATRLAKLNGYKMLVNIATYRGASTFFWGEPNVPAFFASIIEKGDCCIDGGANMGHYGFYFAHLTGERGRVLFAEPQPYYSQLLAASVKLNQWEDRISIYDQALWNENDATFRFYLSTNPNEEGTASVIRHGVYQDESKFVNVTSLMADEILRRENIRKVKFFKIDVERAELQVLEGAAHSLKSRLVDVIYIEMSMNSEAYKLLESYSYCGYIYDERNDMFYASVKIQDSEIHDFVFVSPEYLDTFKKLVNISSY